MYLRFLEGECNANELQELLDYLETHGTGSPLTEAIGRALLSSDQASVKTQARAAKIVKETDAYLETVLFAPKQTARVRRLWMARVSAVAVMLLLVGMGFWYVLYKGNENGHVEEVSVAADVLPGTRKASLVLSDGSSYELDTLEGGIKITDNQIYYGSGAALTARLADLQATVYAPRGGEYKVDLADGSEVWLNADSKLTYPLSFSGNTRLVEVEGEAYFNVHHDAERPFIVRSKGQEVKVLGTTFVVHSYPAEEVQTTLVSGRVEVHVDGQSKVALRPGQQLAVDKGRKELREVNIEAYTGWKNGLFIFHDIPLATVLPQLARWYDIEVPTQGIPDVRVFGEIDRNTKLSEVVHLLETATDVRFKIEERRLVIKRK